MKMYYHPKCIFDIFKKARATTKIIEDPTDLEGWQDVEQKDREMILKLIKETDRGSSSSSSPSKPLVVTPTKKASAKSKKNSNDDYEDSSSPSASTSGERGKLFPSCFNCSHFITPMFQGQPMSGGKSIPATRTTASESFGDSVLTLRRPLDIWTSRPQ